MPNCLTCGAGIDEYDSAYYARNMLCIPCYTRKASESFASCSRCGSRVKADEARRRQGGLYCTYCASELERQDALPNCSICGSRIEGWQEKTRSSSGQFAHASCTKFLPPGKRPPVSCVVCGKETDRFRLIGGKPVCSRCASSQARGSPLPARTLMASVVDRIGAMLG